LYRKQVKNTDNTETKHNPAKANNKKHSKTKLPSFSRLLQQSARKQGGLILLDFQAHTGQSLGKIQTTGLTVQTF